MDLVALPVSWSPVIVRDSGWEAVCARHRLRTFLIWCILTRITTLSYDLQGSVRTTTTTPSFRQTTPQRQWDMIVEHLCPPTTTITHPPLPRSTTHDPRSSYSSHTDTEQNDPTTTCALLPHPTPSPPPTHTPTSPSPSILLPTRTDRPLHPPPTHTPHPPFHFRCWRGSRELARPLCKKRSPQAAKHGTDNVGQEEPDATWISRHRLYWAVPTKVLSKVSCTLSPRKFPEWPCSEVPECGVGGSSSPTSPTDTIKHSGRPGQSAHDRVRHRPRTM